MAVAWRKHDAGFFSLELPSDWVMREPANGTILVHDRRGDISLTLIAVSKPAHPNLALPTRMPSGKEAQLELQKWLDTQKNIALRQSPRLVPNTRHTTAATEGVERNWGGKTPWYKRIFRRAPLKLWRFWAVLNPHMLVLASTTAHPELLEKHRALLDRILLSLHLPERDILLGRHFADKVVSLARSYFPELTVAIIDDAHLRCGSQPVSLTPLHRRYLAAPEDLPTHVKSFFAEVQSDLPASDVAGEWAAARHSILPSFIATANADVLGLVHEEWVNQLSIAYLLEDENAPDAGDRAITTADVKRWRVDPEILHEQALKNLVVRSHGHAMEVHKSEGYTMLLIVAPEKHNAVRLLLPQLHSILREHLGPTFYAAIPTPEFLLAFSTGSEEVLNRVRQQIAADFARAKNGVSPKIFLVTPDGIAGDPAESEDFDI